MSQNLTPAQNKAIENGGTNNAVIGGSLVKKGIFEDSGKGLHEFRFVPVGTMAKAIEDEKNYAEAIEREENETPTSENAEIAFMKRDAERAEIEVLREEFEDAEGERREEIVARLAVLGTVVYPEGTPQHTEYVTKLHAALAEWQGINIPAMENAAKFVGSVIETIRKPLDFVPDAEVAFAEAIDAGDKATAAGILDATVPAVIVRDPSEKRYAHIERWTDDNLEVKYGILSRRIARRTLLKADRMQAERQCQIVEQEMKVRGLRP